MTANAELIHRILDAAEAVVVRQGIGNLTLEAVAVEAGISKGGLLHHFPSKDKLIEAMVRRCAEGWRECSIGAYEAAPPGRGRMARALLGHLADTDSWSDQCQRSSSAVFAALAQNPALIEPMRAVYAEIRQRLNEDDLPAGVAETVAAAMDGLWLYRVLGLTTVDAALMERIRRALEPLVAGTAEGANGRASIAPGARVRGVGTRADGRSAGATAQADGSGDQR